MVIPRLSRRQFVLAAGGLVASQAGRPVAAQMASPVASPTALGYPSLRIEATNRGLQVPARIAAGRILVTLANHSSQGAQAVILAQPANIAVTDIVAAFAQLPHVPPTWFYDAHFTGGPDVIPAGGQSQAIIDVTPGRYVAVNPPQQAVTFTVTGEAGGTPAASVPPPAGATVTLIDFAFKLPQPITPGRHIWRAVNRGTQLHMMDLNRVPAGTTLQQGLTFLERPASATPAPGGLHAAAVVPRGGLTLLAPGVTAWPVVELTAGRYLASCSVPDPKTGKPHFELGMVAVFDVGAAATPAA